MKLTGKELNFMQCIRRFHSIQFWEMNRQLSGGEAMLLYYICESEEKDASIPVSVLSERTHMHPAGVSRLMRKMEDNGMIIRNVNAGNRRNVLVKATAKGRKINKEVCENIHAFWDDVFSRIPAKDIKELMRITNQVADSIEQTRENMQKTET